MIHKQFGHCHIFCAVFHLWFDSVYTKKLHTFCDQLYSIQGGKVSKTAFRTSHETKLRDS